jgi:HD domain
MPAVRPEELAATPAERAALAELRRLTGVTDGPMERHAVRVFVLAEELARREGTTVDREVLLVASFVHDLGLYVAGGGEPYVTTSRTIAGRLTRGWEPERARRCAEAIERHHELTSQGHRGAEVELFRRADRIEVTAAAATAGLPRPWLRALRRAVPPTGLHREIAVLLVRHGRERGLASLVRIFRP